MTHGGFKLAENRMTRPELINAIYHLLIESRELSARQISVMLQRWGKEISSHEIGMAIQTNSKWGARQTLIKPEYRQYEIVKEPQLNQKMYHYRLHPEWGG